LSELLASADHESHMMQHVENLRTHSQANKMITNQNKSKEMVLGSLAKQPIPFLTIQSDVDVIDRVITFKSFGVTL